MEWRGTLTSFGLDSIPLLMQPDVHMPLGGNHILLSAELMFSLTQLSLHNYY